MESADKQFSAMIRVNGQERTEFYPCVQQITVTEDLDVGASFQFRLALCRNDDGSWPHLDEDEMKFWNRVTIIAAFPDVSDVILDGYITHVHVQTTPQEASMYADFEGVDASYVMNLQHITKVWKTGQTYEQIAQEIIEKYKLNANIASPDASAGGSSGPPPSVTQRSTDLRFLRELSRRKGYEFYVRGGDAYFQPPDLAGTPQKAVVVNFGDKTNCYDLRISADGTRPTEAMITRVDPDTGEAKTVSTKESGLTPMGTTDAADSRGYGVPPTRVVLRRHAPMTDGEMNDLVRSTMVRYSFWVKAVGTVNGLRYGRVLRSKKLVSILGLGVKAYNGNYYVKKVTHTLTPTTYSMQFEAYRNRSGELGNESYVTDSPEAPVVPVAVGAGADTDLVTVRDSGAQVMPA
jgi:uncharacterized protein